MSDDAQTPGARKNTGPAGTTGGGTPAGDPQDHGVWPAPADGGAGDAVPQDGPLVDLGAPDTPATAGTPDPWAPPAHGTPASGRGVGGPGAGGPGNPAAGGPGETLAAGDPQPWSSPSAASSPSWHDQQTVTSFPAMGTPAPPAAHGSAAHPFAPPAAGEPVPPPPVAPDGPGRVPYGYPGGYGHPAAQPPGYGGAPGQAYYGWTGMAPMPSNGPGVAGLVLGIISAVVFCLWPVAVLLGVLGVVFGAIGRGKAARGEATNPGQALAGIICGAVGTVLGIGFGVLVLTTSL
ncbi:hypothetical protein SUDANB176_05379 [Streptomyces sp. enrichment culture]|uniref:DUF4190 domain-containing protein n=1 Tax=Streptomyces sp. enrichment culture TaxID=1795815 RepID=UPI003F54980F